MTRRHRLLFAATLLLTLAAAGFARRSAPQAPAASTDYGPAIARLEEFIEHEMKDKPS